MAQEFAKSKAPGSTRSQVASAKGLRSAALTANMQARMRLPHEAAKAKLRERLAAEIPDAVTDEDERERRLDMLIRAHYKQLQAKAVAARRAAKERQAEARRVERELGELGVNDELTTSPNTSG